MEKVGVAPIGLLVLCVALALAPAAGVGPPTADGGPDAVEGAPSPAADGVPGTADRADPEADRLGREDGYWYDESIAVDPSDGLTDEELDAVVGRSMARVERLRRLEFEERPPVEVISRSEHRNRTADRYANVSTADRLHQNTKFEALFMIGEDTDAIAVQRGNTGANVLGYYSPEAEEIVIVSENETTPKLDEITLAQELFHALQDQRYDISSYNRTTEERNNAINGIVEGDGNYVDHLYQGRCAAEWSCLRPSRPSPDGGGDDVHVGLLVLGFQPYSDGPAFVRGIEEREGWDGVNAVYDDPPASTEQTIHPEKYGVDAPQPVRIDDRAGDAWRVLDVDGGINYAEFGEAGLFSMLLYPGLEPGESAVVPPRSFYAGDGFDRLNYSHPYTAGWDGDRLVPYVRNDSAATNETGYVWRTVWDSAADAREFERGYRELLRVRDGERIRDGVWRIDDGPYADAFRVVRRNDTVTITNAPSVAALDGVRRPPEPDRGDTDGTQRPTTGETLDDGATSRRSATGRTANVDGPDRNPFGGQRPIDARGPLGALAPLVALAVVAAVGILRRRGG